MATENTEISAMQGVEGYNCDFVESPPNDLVCKICLCVSRDPQQANICCGNNFCKKCLERFVQSTVIDKDVCPYCRQHSFSFVPDLRAQRQVLNLQVFCPNKQLGCMWTGELRSMEKHLDRNANTNSNGCPFTELECNNNCGLVIQHRLLEHHLKSDCKLRQVNCKYCNITGNHQWITGVHQQEECPKYPVECPNHCETGYIKREDITRHLEGCPLALVECPLNILGCKSVIRRDCRLQHMEETAEQHMVCTKNAIVSVQNELKYMKQMFEVKSCQLDSTETKLQNVLERLSATENELDSVKQELKDVKEELLCRMKENEVKFQQLLAQFEAYTRAPISSSSVDQCFTHDTVKNAILMIKVGEFVRKRIQREGWYSQSFYTSKLGYKMCLYFNLGGIGKGRGTHISIGAFLMKGDNDDNLSWPVQGSLNIKLLNQIADSNHVEISLKFGRGNYSERVRNGTRSFSGCHCDQVIAHSCLKYSPDDNTQYLKDDCIVCSVVSFKP